MKEKDSQGKKGGDWKKTLGTILLLILALVLVASIVVAIGFAVDRWWSDNTVNNAPEPLEVAIAVLTVLVAFVAIYMGLTTWMSKRDWEAFEKRQEPIIKETKEELEKVKEETKELNWIDNLRRSVKKDPHLNTEDAKGTIQSIKEHYFERDKYNEAWEYYGVARWFDKENQCATALKYYIKAVEVDLEDNSKSNELRKHIWQSLGLDYFRHGIQHEANGNNEEAIKAYKAAIESYDLVIKNNPQFAEAHNNKAITLIQLGKIEGDKSECYNEAIECLNDAIKIEGNYDHYYDKARAQALLNQPDAIESLTRAFKLVNHEKLGDLLHHLTSDLDDFRNFKGQKEFEELRKRYTDIIKGNN